MALVPLSILFEILLPVFAIIFAEKGEFGRWIGICIWPLEIALLTQSLTFISDASGTLVVSTIAFPTAVQGIVVVFAFLLWIWSMVDIWYFRQGIKQAEKLTI